MVRIGVVLNPDVAVVMEFKDVDVCLCHSCAFFHKNIEGFEAEGTFDRCQADGAHVGCNCDGGISYLPRAKAVACNGYLSEAKAVEILAR